jgi:hypothetical protein
MVHIEPATDLHPQVHTHGDVPEATDLMQERLRSRLRRIRRRPAQGPRPPEPGRAS